VKILSETKKVFQARKILIQDVKFHLYCKNFIYGIYYLE